MSLRVCIGAYAVNCDVHEQSTYKTGIKWEPHKRIVNKCDTTHNNYCTSFTLHPAGCDKHIPLKFKIFLSKIAIQFFIQLTLQDISRLTADILLAYSMFFLGASE